MSPVFQSLLGMDAQSPPTMASDGDGTTWPATTPSSRPRSPAQAAMTRLAIDAIARMARDPKVAPRPGALRSQDVQKQLVEQVATNMNLGQLGLFVSRS